MKDYKLYIFDMDLTLLNTLEAARLSYQSAAKIVGEEIKSEDIISHLAVPLETSYERFKHPTASYETFVDEFVRVTKEEIFEKSFFYDDAKEIIDYLLKNNKKVAIVTNRPDFVVTPILEKAGMKNVFSSVITYEKCKRIKPYPDPILLCLEETGVFANEAVYIGDAKNDYLAAVASNVDFIAIERYNNCNFDAKVKVNKLTEIK